MEIKSSILIFILLSFLLQQGGVCYGQPITSNVNFIASKNNDAYHRPILCNVVQEPPILTKLVNASFESVEPQVSFSPINLSFTESDWQLEDGKSIKISIYVPPQTHIKELRSKLSIPHGWEVVPNAEISRTFYVQAQDTIYAYDMGNFSGNDEYITDQFWIKPSANTASAKYHLVANSSIEYNCSDPTGSSDTDTVNVSQTINLVLIKNEKPIDWFTAIVVLCTVVTTLLALYSSKLGRKKE